jgi:8-oxo-dGTP diphosphatase
MLHSHFGVYGIILNLDQKKILLIIKSRGPYTGRYDLPGGSIEDSELLEDCLYREIEEETGCKAFNIKQAQAISSLFHYHNGKEDCSLKHIGVIYQADIKGIPRSEGDGEDSNGCIWYDIDSLDKNKVTPFVVWAIDYIKQK